MADLQGRKVFKVFNQDFIVDERYTVTKELGQGAYGIVWYVYILVWNIRVMLLRVSLNLSDCIHGLEPACAYGERVLILRFTVRRRTRRQMKELQ